jgi:hypothetical protein
MKWLVVLASLALASCVTGASAQQQQQFTVAKQGCAAQFLTGAQASNADYTRCVNSAELRVWAITPQYRDYDLLLAKHQYAVSLAEKVDRGELLAQDAEAQMLEIRSRLNSEALRRDGAAIGPAQQPGWQPPVQPQAPAPMPNLIPPTTRCWYVGNTMTCRQM